MTFRGGQKVICVDNSNNPGCVWRKNAPGSQPVLNAVYTVRDSGLTGTGRPGIRLVEIKLAACLDTTDHFYRASRFRPAVEKKTDISIFTELLKPKQRSKELCGND